MSKKDNDKAPKLVIQVNSIPFSRSYRKSNIGMPSLKSITGASKDIVVLSVEPLDFLR